LAVSSCLPRSCGGVGARWSGAWRAAVRVRGGASGSAVCGGWRAQATAARTVTAVARAGKADLLVEPRNLGHERVVRVGIGQQRTDRKQHLQAVGRGGLEAGPRLEKRECVGGTGKQWWGGGRGVGGERARAAGGALETVSAGDHWLCKMSRQMLPLLLTLQW